MGAAPVSLGRGSHGFSPVATHVHGVRAVRNWLTVK